MFFSVIIPVYNVEKFIEQSVNSVLNQEEKDLEIILVDDGSTDSSGKICDAFAEKYPDIIRVIHKENEGLLLTRRCGIRAAKGDYFVHLDSDDYMMPGALASIRKTILKYDADMVICKVAYGAADGKSIDYYSKLPFENGQIFEGEGKEQLYRQLLCEGCGEPITTGRFCAKCKTSMANNLNNTFAKPKPALQQPVKKETKAGMRFLDT